MPERFIDRLRREAQESEARENQLQSTRQAEEQKQLLLERSVVEQAEKKKLLRNTASEILRSSDIPNLLTEFRKYLGSSKMYWRFPDEHFPFDLETTAIEKFSWDRSASFFESIAAKLEYVHMESSRMGSEVRVSQSIGVQVTASGDIHFLGNGFAVLRNGEWQGNSQIQEDYLNAVMEHPFERPFRVFFTSSPRADWDGHS